MQHILVVFSIYRFDCCLSNAKNLYIFSNKKTTTTYIHNLKMHHHLMTPYDRFFFYTSRLLYLVCILYNHAVLYISYRPIFILHFLCDKSNFLD